MRKGISFEATQRITYFMQASTTANDIGSLLCDKRYTGITLNLWPEEAARTALEKLRWPDGIQCPVCGSASPIYRQNRRGVSGYYRCQKAHAQCAEEGTGRPVVFTVRDGTILERSHVPFAKWIHCLAIWAVANNTRNTSVISIANLARQIRVNRKTAASILSLLRTLEFGNQFRNQPQQEFLLSFMTWALGQIEEKRRELMQA